MCLCVDKRLMMFHYNKMLMKSIINKCECMSTCMNCNFIKHASITLLPVVRICNKTSKSIKAYYNFKMKSRLMIVSCEAKKTQQ